MLDLRIEYNEIPSIYGVAHLTYLLLSRCLQPVSSYHPDMSNIAPPLNPPRLRKGDQDMTNEAILGSIP